MSQNIVTFIQVMQTSLQQLNELKYFSNALSG